jgi:hypothetical protein
MRIAAMGHDKIRYLVYSKGRWRWQPTRAMRKHGFQNVKLRKRRPGAGQQRVSGREPRLQAEGR